MKDRCSTSGLQGICKQEVETSMFADGVEAGIMELIDPKEQCVSENPDAQQSNARMYPKSQESRRDCPVMLYTKTKVRVMIPLGICSKRKGKIVSGGDGSLCDKGDSTIRSMGTQRNARGRPGRRVVSGPRARH
jgi:hypothetical protein